MCSGSIQIGISSVCSCSFSFSYLPTELELINLAISVRLTVKTGLNYGVGYTNAADDDLVYSTTRVYFDKVEQYTRSTGQHEPFIYMNYALPTQRVIQSYGQENVDFLRTVSRKYDPRQIFQILVPGGFKLGPLRPSTDGDPVSI